MKNFSNTHLVDRLRDQAEILQDGGEAPAAVNELWPRG